jgi:spore maturation protein CgeB
MRILLSGYHNPHYLTVTEYIERSVRSLGHELISFNDRKHIIPGRLRKKIGILQKVSVAVINRGLVKLATQTQPHLILVIGGHRITRQSLSTLRKSGSCLVLWTTDVPHTSDMMFTTAPLYNQIFCQGTEYVQALANLGIVGLHWLPMACDPEIHCNVSVSNEEIAKFGKDIAFVGSYYPRRAEFLEKLSDYNLGIWGPGWENLPTHSPLRRALMGSYTTPETWRKIYSASKIVLSIHYQDEHFPVFQSSPRVFEALSCGAFVLTDKQKDVLALFRDGEHLVSFSDVCELVERVEFFLAHLEQRQVIAQRGKQEVLERHTYRHRLTELLANIRPMSTSARSRTDRQEEKIYQI